MKRQAAADLGPSTKRRKLDLNGLFMYKRRFTELRNDDVAGFLTGLVINVLPKVKCFKLELSGDQFSVSKQVYVDMGSQGKEPRTRNINIAVDDEIHLSLKGVEVQKGKKVTGLRYAKGITFKLLKRSGTPLAPPKIFNTWPGPKPITPQQQKQPPPPPPPKRDPDSWFSSSEPADDLEDRSDPSSDGSEADATAVGIMLSSEAPFHDSPDHSSRSATLAGSSPAQKLPTSSLTNQFIAVSLESPAHLDSVEPRKSVAQPGHKLSRKKSKQAEKLQAADSNQAHARAATPSAADHSSVDPARVPPPTAGQVINIGSVRAGETSNDAVNQRKLSAGSTSTACETCGGTPPVPASERSAVFDDTDLSPKVVLSTGERDYVSLEHVQSLHKGSFISVIGIVTRSQAFTTATSGDLTKSITLMDKSNFNTHGGYFAPLGAGFTVNLFTWDCPAWLPPCKIGDVLLLRNLKVCRFNETNRATCFKEKLCWAIYDSATGQPTHGDLNGVPTTASPEGKPVSPFWDLKPAELQYCAELSKWGKAIEEEKRRRQGPVTQISAPLQGMNKKREHRLIRDADPDMEPRGFFDCTVEILNVYENGSNYSVYVTDYTAKAGMFQPTESWCPPNLSDKVLQVEMYGEAAVQLGRHLKAGQYWKFSNMRMKLSRGKYIEGGFKEACKAAQLDETDAAGNPELKALLERKKMWEGTNTSPNTFEHQLFEDVGLELFNATVEVLHSQFDSKGFSTIYVTDYTKRDDLLPPPSAGWTKNLDDMIVKIDLRDSQSNYAKYLPAGTFCHIKNLKLRKSHVNDRKTTGLAGLLSGKDRLIDKFNEKHAKDDDSLELLRRKEEWRENIRRASAPARPQTKTGSSKAIDAGTIKKLRNIEKSPALFTVRARVVKIAPSPVEHCVWKFCNGCHKQISADDNACSSCSRTKPGTPMTLTYALKFLLQDEEGDLLDVQVDQKFEPLKDFPPRDLWETPEIGEDLRSRLRPYAGDLLEASGGVLPNERLNTEFETLTVERYINQNGKNLHRLR